SARIIHTHFNGQISDTPAETALFAAGAEAGDRIAKQYESLEYNQAMRDIMALADQVNQYIDSQKPWSLVRSPETKDTALAVCSLSIQLFRQLTIYLKPVLP